MRLDALLIAWWTPVLAPVLTTVARRSKTPVIGIVHNATPHEAMPFAAYLARRFLASCTGVVTMSDGVAAEVERLGFTGAAASTPHPSYEPPGALPTPEAARAALGLPPDGPVLLFFGLVRPYKGLDVLIEALPAVLEAHDGATLVVAGEWYGDQDAIRARMAALGLTGHVRVDDRYVPDDELPTLFSAADLLVQPYRSATQSGVLQLAASFGVPCVVTDVGGLAGPIRRFGAGHVAPPGDAAQLARAVIGALEPGHRDELAEGARAMAAAHGWDAFARAVEDLLARSIPETD